MIRFVVPLSGLPVQPTARSHKSLIAASRNQGARKGGGQAAAPLPPSPVPRLACPAVRRLRHRHGRASRPWHSRAHGSAHRACPHAPRLPPALGALSPPPAGRRAGEEEPNCQRATAALHRRPFRADAGPLAESEGRGTPPSATPTTGDEPRAATAHRPSQSQARTQSLRQRRLLWLGPPPRCWKGGP
jgi:hypothetical protein